jgi:hypothetical protein
MADFVTRPPECLPRGGMTTAAKARKTQRKKRKGPQITPMTRGRADNTSIDVRLDKQGDCAAGPFAFVAALCVFRVDPCFCRLTRRARGATGLMLALNLGTDMRNCDSST